MDIIRHTLASILSLLAIAACSGSGSGVQTAREFPLVQVPSMLEDDQKLDFMLDHFWDNFLDSSKLVSCDSTLINGVKPGDVEQAFANYTMLMEQVPLQQAQHCMRAIALKLNDCRASGIQANVFKGFGSIIERYLYDPNSPVRDEDLYTPYALVMSESPYVTSSRRQVYAYEAEVSARNARDTKASDFAFSDNRGKKYSLYGVSAEYTILFFSNPGCTACKEIIRTLSTTPAVDDLIMTGDLAVVNVYIDEDLKEWYEYMPVYPPSWYNGYDHNHIIRDEELYNVRAIPSLYLLDSDKKVVLKDVTPERLMATLQNIFSL